MCVGGAPLFIGGRGEGGRCWEPAALPGGGRTGRVVLEHGDGEVEARRPALESGGGAWRPVKWS